HKSLLKRQGDTICLASASALYDDAALYRKKDLVLVENGVDSAHFKVERSKEGLDRKLLEILKKGHPIAGYFGALADWLDYDLIRATAGQLPYVEFVLIGIDYDGSVKALHDAPPNVHILPPVPYALLPRVAVWFDIALLPFRLNHITAATSPLKLFEYMALQIPIVSTSVREVLKYKSVVRADDACAFAAAIEDR